MARFTIKVLGLSGCLLVLLCGVPVQAAPFFVMVYGRTYKVDPRLPSNELKGPKPQEALKALPADIARGPGFKPSHEQVLAEVEERTWIARTSLRTNWRRVLSPARDSMLELTWRPSSRRSRDPLRTERHRPASRSCRRSMIVIEP